MKKSLQFAAFSAAFGALATALPAAEIDGAQLASSVRQATYANPSAASRIVASEVSKHPNYSCEIVRAAIQGSQADSAQVAGIVRAASSASPENMRLIAQCAVATAPDSLANVQGVLAGIEPAAGETASTSTRAHASAPVSVVSTPVSAEGQPVRRSDSKSAEFSVYADSEGTVRIGRAVPTSDQNHMIVVNDEGKKIGDIRAVEATAASEVRATVSTVVAAGRKWLYTGLLTDGTYVENMLVVQNPDGSFTALGGGNNPLNFIAGEGSQLLRLGGGNQPLVVHPQQQPATEITPP